METTDMQQPIEGCPCPLCRLWWVYHRSETAQHVKVIQRESLMIARAVIDSLVRIAEAELSRIRPKAEESAAPPTASPSFSEPIPPLTPPPETPAV